MPNFGQSDTNRLSNFNVAEMYSVQSSRVPTPRPSNFEETFAPGAQMSSPRFGYYPTQTIPTSYSAPNPEISSTMPRTGKTHQAQIQNQGSKANHDAKELHMFVWSSSPSPVSEGGVGGGLHYFGGQDFGASEQAGRSDQAAKEIKLLVNDIPQNGGSKVEKISALVVEAEIMEPMIEIRKVSQRSQNSGQAPPLT